MPMGMRCGMQLVLRMILLFRYSVRHMHERVDNFVDIQLCPKLHTFADGTGVVEDMKYNRKPKVFLLAVGVS